jgi:circadian clock protein KaiC
MATAPEFAIADAVLWLTSGRYEQREIRALQVLKLRGSGFLSGRHAYRLAADGMRVFPRLADRAEANGYGSSGGRVSSGVKSLDSLLGGGYPAGSSTLVVGPSGVGKTVLGLHFAVAGARAGDATAFATFDENPAQLESTAAGFGWSFATPELQLMYRSAVDLHLDEWVYELLDLIEARGVRRVFIDGVSNLIAAAHEKVRFQEYIYSLVQRLTRHGITMMMSLESAELFGPTRRIDMPLSQVADNVVLLQFVRRENEYRRSLTTLKTRGFEAGARLNEYAITASGIELREPDGATRPPA